MTEEDVLQKQARAAYDYKLAVVDLAAARDTLKQIAGTIRGLAHELDTNPRIVTEETHEYILDSQIVFMAISDYGKAEDAVETARVKAEALGALLD